MTLRIGHGFDAHRLVEGRPCILGGVAIDASRAPILLSVRVGGYLSASNAGRGRGASQGALAGGVT